jgi:hypothetical protein
MAQASSTLPPKTTENYAATNVLDGEPTTCWVDGGSGDNGGTAGNLKRGREWLRFTFLKPITPARIDFANGYQKDDTTYPANGRVQGLKIEYSNGRSQTVDLRDTPDVQYVVPITGPVAWIKLTVLSVYPGSEERTVALSEVRFYERVSVPQ